MSPACVTRLLKSLVEDGYVLRSDDKHDLRRNSVCISEKGKKLMDDTRRTFDTVDQRVFEGFDREEIESLCARLEHVQENLRVCEVEEEAKGSALN